MSVYTGYSPNVEVPTMRQFVLMKIARAGASRRAKGASLARGQQLMQLAIRWILQLTGFGCLTVAGFSWNLMAGLITAAVSCFAVSWLATGDRGTPTDHDPRR